MGAPRNRVLYQSEALFVVPNALGVQSGNVGQLYRVTTFNNDFNIAREDVTALGQLDPLDQLITTPPTVNFSATWLDYGIGNEQSVGFVCNGFASCISGFLSQANEPYNYYLLTVPEGFDAVGYSGSPTGNDVFAFGNAYVSSYSTQGAVGGLPSSSVQWRALNNTMLTTSSGGSSPGVNTSGVRVTGNPVVLPVAVSGLAGDVAAIRPGDITLNLASSNASLGVDLTNVKIQSYNMSLQLNRGDINQLGSFYPYAILLNPPFPATLTVECELGSLTTGDLSNVFCNDQLYDLFVYLHNPCGGSVAKQIEFRGAKLVSENFQSAIQGNKRISLSYETRLSAQGVTRGVYLSGIQ